MTDIATLFLSCLFLIFGAARGFLNSLLVPFSIIITTIISIIYFQLTKDAIISLVIGLVGPILLNIALKILLKKLAVAYNSDIKPGSLSRFGGALLTLAWGWVFITFALILLAVMPPWGKTLEAVHNDVVKSASYFFAKPLGESLFASSMQNVPAVAGGPNTTSDTSSLAEDPRFQKVLQDPEIQKEIDAHDIVKLMSNPKMIDLTKQILSDPATMKKVMTVYATQTHPPEPKTP